MKYAQFVDENTVNLDVQTGVALHGLIYAQVYFRPEILGRVGFHPMLELEKPEGDTWVPTYSLAASMITKAWRKTA